MAEQIETEWSGRHAHKDALRAEVWFRLQQAQAAIHDPFGHIPNFVGAQQAADRLAELPCWQQAHVIKCNPDTPQSPVRLRALQDGKRLYMAVPRLSQTHCFVELNADTLHQQQIPLEQAAASRTALHAGRTVSFEEMLAIDLVIVGCVAVSRQGDRTGKGAGFADLELAMLKQFGLLPTVTPILTTVHPIQIVGRDEIPMQPHDWALDYIITPQETIETHSSHPRPAGIDWNALRPDQLENIPILQTLQSLNQ